MDTAVPGVAQDAITTEQKILAAIQQSEQVAQIFSPAIATAMQAGIAVEPIFSGMVHLFAQLFRHHVTQPAPAK